MPPKPTISQNPGGGGGAYKDGALTSAWAQKKPTAPLVLHAEQHAQQHLLWLQVGQVPWRAWMQVRSRFEGSFRGSKIVGGHIVTNKVFGQVHFPKKTTKCPCQPSPTQCQPRRHSVFSQSELSGMSDLSLVLQQKIHFLAIKFAQHCRKQTETPSGTVKLTVLTMTVSPGGGDCARAMLAQGGYKRCTHAD